MKFLIFFAVAAFFGSVHCDKECFRAVFKECQKDGVPMEGMTLCDEVRNHTSCVWKLASKCNMPFWREALSLYSAVGIPCSHYFKKYFDKDKACYGKALSDSVCVAPIDKVIRELKTTKDVIRANKQICNLFEPYSICVEKEVEENCHGSFLSVRMFKQINKPLRALSKSLCEQLIIPTDEKETRPDSFGMLNVFASVLSHLCF